MTRRILLVLTLVLAALIPAGAATAAAPADKLTVLSNWTQPTAASTAAWNSARANQGAWAAYGFDWSTDYCSDSPDNPLGFHFDTSCWHHDFGYRNYKAVGQFPANKDRIDSMFYADLKRVCATYSTVVQPACYSLAWTYYEAVHVFGSLAAVSQADLDKAARIKSQSLQAAR
jgi:phospholipase A2-like protein